MDPKFALVSELYQQRTDDGHEELAELLLNFFTAYGKERELLSWVISQEVKSANNPGTLFREESVLKWLITLNWRKSGGPRFVKVTVKPLVLEIRKAALAQGSLEVKMESLFRFYLEILDSDHFCQTSSLIF